MTAYDPNGVPILFLGEGRKIGISEAGSKALAKAHGSALKAAESDGDGPKLLIGESVIVHNADPDGPPWTSIVIGASTLDEAVKEVIGAHDTHLGDPEQSQDHIHPPEWVASTHAELAKHLADYYSCDVRKLTELV